MDTRHVRLTKRLTRIAAALLWLALPAAARAQTAQPVVPLLSELTVNPATGVATAYFGYRNPNATSVTVRFGEPNNYFFPSPQDRGQPERFLPGEHRHVFAVAFRYGEEPRITWILNNSPATADSAAALSAGTTAFTYQGRLTDAGAAAEGQYDLRFALYDAAEGGTQQGGAAVVREGVAVTRGVFTVTLDFGAEVFNGSARFLEIAVRPGAASGDDPFTALAPRQPLTPAPYAIHARSAASAASAANAANASQLGGVEAGQYVRTNDARLSDARPPAPGSANYVQNTTTRQAGANFNIGGDGTVAGTLTAATLRADTQFNLGAQRVLAAPSNNTLLGKNAGFSNAGDGNTFVGNLAGAANTLGGNNTFVGYEAGGAVGQDNTTGSSNTFVGWRARPLVPSLTNATAVGAGAAVRTSDSLVLGSTNVSVGIGTDSPKAKLHVTGGNLYVDDRNGVILKAQDGNNCFRLVVFNNGSLNAVQVACP
jgi:hypothetical protein